MMFRKRRRGSELSQGILMAYGILLFHVAMIGGVGILVLLFSGILNYFAWILAGGGIILTGSGYLIIRSLRKDGNMLFNILSRPEFKGKDIEIKMLGGLLTFKAVSPDSKEDALRRDQERTRLAGPEKVTPAEDPERLARQLECGDISFSEYDRRLRRLYE